jgi:hypothetical protein
MPYIIMHPTDAISITGATPEELTNTLRGARNWPANRYKGSHNHWNRNVR